MEVIYLVESVESNHGNRKETTVSHLKPSLPKAFSILGSKVGDGSNKNTSSENLMMETFMKELKSSGFHELKFE